RRRHTRFSRDWSSDVCSSDLKETPKKEDDTKTAAPSSSDAVKIPAFLDCTITAKANTVVYDNLNLKKVSGKMIIRDEAVTLQNRSEERRVGKECSTRETADD